MPIQKPLSNDTSVHFDAMGEWEDEAADDSESDADDSTAFDQAFDDDLQHGGGPCA